MKLEGGCYCGALRYEADEKALMKVQCHCRECQYLTGGGPNLTMGVSTESFKYTKGKPNTYKRDDLDGAVAREFCGTCGTPMTTRVPTIKGAVLVKVGTFDDPAIFEAPQVAIFLCDKQPYHLVADGVAQFDRMPG